MNKKWTAYKDAAGSVITGLREAIAIASGGVRRECEGASGMQWELDARTWEEGFGGLLLVEVRQYDSPLNQAALASMAWRIQSFGGARGVVASPLPQEEGLRSVARAADSEYLRLTDDSTAENYIAEFLSRRFHGLTMTEDPRLDQAGEGSAKCG